MARHLWRRGFMAICLFWLSFGVTRWCYRDEGFHLSVIPVETVEDLKIPGDLETDGDLLPDAALNPASLQPLLNEAGRLLGGTSDGNWHGPENWVSYLATLRKFQVYSTTKRLGEVWGRLDGRRPADENGGYRLELAQSQAALPPDTAFLIQADWNPFPRIPVYIRENYEKYHALMEKVLAEMGLAAPVIVNQAIQVDLDGDGREELLLNAGYSPDEGSPAPEVQGDAYSVIVLYQKNSPDDQVMIVFGACREPIRYEIRFVADVTGDWGMEFLVRETRRSGPETPQIRDILLKLDQKAPYKIWEIDWRPEPAQ